MIAHTKLPLEEIPEEKLLFYDCETDNQFPPYAKLRLIGAQIGLDGEPFVVTPDREAEFKRMLMDPTVYKYGWNNKNFDDIILHRHGYTICEENSHDLFLAAKAIAPHLPSYSLKFVNWYYFGDCHWPEMDIEEWALKNRRDKWEAPPELLNPYCLYDIYQTKQTFLLLWNKLVRERWEPYLLDLSQGEPLREMELVGGIYLDADDLQEKVAALQLSKLYWEQEAYQRSHGQVQNPNSSKQMGLYLDEKGFALELSANGDFSVPKSLLIDLIDLDDSSRDRNDVARCTYEVRKVNSSLKYYENYLEALQDETSPGNWIPVQFSISNARTRRYTSNSKYKLNHQNPDKEAKKVQLVPPGWLGVWFDETQVENVVHIYESDDFVRRAAYEADPDWNEYAWLANRILGGNRNKNELDNIPSPQLPHWSIYKQFKTVKLALNFGLGIAKFCRTAGLSERIGRHMFELVHEACPAIRLLQNRIAEDIVTIGYVEDVFGHIYTGDVRKAYKVLAYLVQGCGTGSLPKAHIRANYDTLRRYDTDRVFTGPMCGTTHDENSFRLNLRLGSDCIIAILQECYHNMTDKFSYKFDNIPLRAKMYLSRTTTHEASETKIGDHETIRSFCV